MSAEAAKAIGILRMARALGWRDASIGPNRWSGVLKVKGRPLHSDLFTARDAGQIEADYREAVAAGVIVERL